MATETLRPNGAGNECSILEETGAACPDHYQNVDEVTPDGNTTRVFAGSGSSTIYYRDLYALPASSGSGTINNVTVYAVCRAGTTDPTKNAYIKLSCRTYSTTYDGSEIELTGNGDGSWDTESNVWATNPNTGSAWTWTEIDALEIGVNIKKGTKSSNVTQVYVEVDYTLGTEKFSSDSGSGSEGAFALTAALSGAESGQGQEAIGSQLAAITAVDTGTSIESGALLKDLFASELGQGRDSLAAKIETPTKGGGMKLWT